MLRRTIALGLAAATAFGGAALVAPPPAGAATLIYTVNDLGDAVDASPGNDVCATAGGVCTLRAAIAEANANSTDDNRIQFSVAGTITAPTSLPSVTDPGLVIDGSTAPGFAIGAPTVSVVGTAESVNTGPTALEVFAPDFTLRALRFGRWNRVLRIANQAPRAIVEGNQLGTNGTAYSDALQIAFGIDIDSADTRIGGATAAQRNQVAGFKARGIDATSGATNLLVQGNYVGTNSAGTAAVAHPDGTTGVTVGGQSTLNVAVESNSASTTLRGNLISGNPGYGVTAPVSANITLVGNLIGTDATGTQPLGNTGIAVAAEKGANLQIGGTGAGDGNVIAATKAVQIAAFDLGAGVLVRSGATATVQGNSIGTNAAGASGLANQGDGLIVQDDATVLTLGGTAAGAGNTIVASTVGSGLRVLSVPVGQTVLATVQGNRFGTNPTGTAKVGNGGRGITVDCGGKAVVGGSAAGAANVISGHAQAGISFCDGRRGSTIQGNRIGTNAAGTAAIANKRGIELPYPSGTSSFGSTPLLIGGTAAGSGNLISGNTERGAQLVGAVTFQGNTVGLNAAGTAALPNGFAGVSAAGDATYGVATIGGPAAGAGNIISGNKNSGILANGNGFVIQGNRIGTNAAGAAFGNEFSGVFVQSVTSGTIGGIGAGEGNTIANGREGVFVLPGASGVSIRGNRIFDHAEQSIELFQYGPDGGGNKDQAPPTMTATVGAQTAVSGTIATDVAGALTIDVYASDACGPDGSGEARERLGSITVNHPGGGASTPFSGNVALPTSGNTVITGTATVPGKGTSQFSHCAVVTDLAVLAEANATKIPLGDEVGTLLSVTNRGPVDATNVAVALRPNLLDFSSADEQIVDPPSQGTITGGTTWTVGALDVGETATVCVHQKAVNATYEVFEGFEGPTFMGPGLELTAATPSRDPYTGNDLWEAIVRLGPREPAAAVCAAPTLAIGDASLVRPTTGTTTMTFPVTLSKPVGRAVTVAYTTQNGTAAAVIDYQARSGTLTIPAGQTTGSIQVPIVGNQSDEPDKAFQVVLSAPVGATLADASATGTVKANGALAGCPSDADKTETFVCHLYWDALGRQAESGGFTYWVNRLKRGDPRSTMVKTYLSQPESRRVLVDRVYVFYLARRGTATELKTSADRLAAKTTTPEAIRIQLLASSEYYTKAGGTGAGWVTSVYRNVFRRNPDAGGQAFWLGKLNAGQTRTQVATGMLTQDEGRRRVVDDIFLRFVRRLPPQSESQPYVGQMKAGRTEADIANAVAASAEYFNRP